MKLELRLNSPLWQYACGIKACKGRPNDGVAEIIDAKALDSAAGKKRLAFYEDRGFPLTVHDMK